MRRLVVLYMCIKFQIADERPFSAKYVLSESARHRLRSGAAQAGNAPLSETAQQAAAVHRYMAVMRHLCIFMRQCENGWKHGNYRPETLGKSLRAFFIFSERRF